MNPHRRRRPSPVDRKIFHNKKELRENIDQIVRTLCDPEMYDALCHRTIHEEPMPSIRDLNDIVEMLRSVLFPGYFGNSELHTTTMSYYIGSTIDNVYRLLSEQIRRGHCFICNNSEKKSCDECHEDSYATAMEFIKKLPHIRHMLSTDVGAAYEGDPAAKNPGETIFCYPSILAMTNYRIAHELYVLEVPLIPRIISEMAHSLTGIDIHPGAQIGENFFIDHGTGVVIGETSVIGNGVRLYQGVTLGAKSFPLDDEGNPIKGIPRHPIVEDDVIIYSGATILGRVTIGAGSVIGGNVWLTHDVPPGTRILQGDVIESLFEYGAGI